jgi:hypothetical protein
MKESEKKEEENREERKEEEKEEEINVVCHSSSNCLACMEK